MLSDIPPGNHKAWYHEPLLRNIKRKREEGSRTCRDQENQESDPKEMTQLNTDVADVGGEGGDGEIDQRKIEYRRIRNQEPELG
jgi:hypothetical protein